MTVTRQANPAVRSMTALEDARWLDRPAGPVRSAVRRALRRTPVRNALHGTWLGHSLHPVLVQAPIGCFLSAAVLDLRGDRDAPAARRLVGAGLLAATPAAVTGLADWAEGHEQQQRVGLVHAAANAAGLLLYGASYARRLRSPGSGRLLSAAGLSAVAAGGFIGGHLAYRQALGPNHAEAVPHLVPPGWQDLCAVDDLPADGEVRQLMLGDQPLTVIRDGGRTHVLSDVCSHLSAPLHQGELDDGCLTCPWHHSVFRVADGSVVRGPATAPVPVFEVRDRDGRIEVRLPGAG
jgi:nitrite reductase/ring-hydroxylating ferredoxin subunit/uncharacterized membrane protein